MHILGFRSTPIFGSGGDYIQRAIVDHSYGNSSALSAQFPFVETKP